MASGLPVAVILAGGLGTRLRPLIPHAPKALAPVGGEPFLYHQLRWLRTNRVADVIICVGYKSEKIMEELGDGQSLGMKLVYSREESPLGTAGAIAKAHLELPEEFLVVNGDTYTDMPLAPLWESHRNRSALATLAITPVLDSSTSGGIELAPDGKITAFREKQPGIPLVSMGIYAMNKGLLNHIPAIRPCSLENDVFPHAPHLYGHISKTPFIDIGSPEGYKKANTQLRAVGCPREGEQ